MAGKTTTEAVNYLRAWRESATNAEGEPMTQSQLARRMGIHSSVISELESGRKQLSDKWLRRVAEALNIQPGFLLFDPKSANMEIVRAAMEVDPDQAEHAIDVLRTFKPRIVR